MGTTTIVGRRASALLAITFVLAVGAIAPVGGMAAAKGDAPKEETTKALPQGDAGQEKRVTLTVEVLLVNKDPTSKPQPAAGTIVRIQGSDDDGSSTNDRGRAKLAAMSKQKVHLQIMVLGADTCTLPEIAVGGGDQTIRVLVDKSETGKSHCRVN